MITQPWNRAALAVTLVALAAPAAWAARTSPSSVPQTEAPRATPAEQAASELADGERQLDKAAAAQADGKADKARKVYERAAKSFRRSAELAPTAAAYNGLGYALRKTGDYDAALEAYDRAIQLQPGFAQAIEYRAEAYLALGRLDDVRQAYMQLFPTARAQADELLAAVNAWLAAGQTADVPSEDLAEFTAWAKERSELAGQTASLAGDGPSRNW